MAADRRNQVANQVTNKVTNKRRINVQSAANLRNIMLIWQNTAFKYKQKP